MFKEPMGITNQKCLLYPKKAAKFAAFRALLGTRTLDPLIKSQLLYQLS